MRMLSVADPFIVLAAVTCQGVRYAPNMFVARVVESLKPRFGRSGSERSNRAGQLEKQQDTISD